MNAHAAWSHPQLLAQVLRPRRDGRSEVALRIDALGEPRRALALEQAIRALPGVQRVAILPTARRLRVVWDTHRLSLDALVERCTAMQCPAQPLPHDDADDARAAELHDALKRLLVAGMCMMQVMAYALVIYLGAVDFVDFTTRGLFRWLGFLTTIPLVAYSAQPFFAGAWRELRARRLGIHLPVALAVALVFLASAYDTLRGAGEIYFDSVNMFVFLLLAARYVELHARHRGNAQGDAAIDAAPLLAQRRRADGTLETVPALALRAGDMAHVAEGATVPADGVLESASARLDEALLSGESRPVLRRRGERLAAGSVLLDGPATLRVECSGEATALARIGALAARARQARDFAAASDRDIARFVVRVLALTTLTAAGWLLVDPARAFDAALAVLVVACPCAFALTAPAAFARALGVLARHGVLVTDGAALDRLARVDVALFDKTGTLGVPQLGIAGVEPLRGDSREEALALAAALARESSHPLARVLADAAAQCGPPRQAEGVEAIAGAGLRGMVAGRALRLGRADFALDRAQAGIHANSALLLADADGAIAAFHLAEHPRRDAQATLDALRGDGIAACIASGDTPARVAALATRLGIADWHAHQAPADKLALLGALRAAGHVVLAVGDGSNDAPILAGADVSAALGGGTGLAQAQADLLLADDRLAGLAHARAVACQVRDIVAQGRRWSLLYNLCAVPFAALGFVPPWLAGIGMSLSSLAVVANALRTGRESGHSRQELRA
ncbi:heavy metal translocating P-type ATPase [Rhodanobacter sp. DHB23]|uniref:heavy metal translocating P-type ATPase n=1 Tax=Rhodanobacter sp. DHB23 TaxID=2775923 RepID=UPI00177E2E18|nr:heavy metal translocating P-type ATPase [Rhodanobacter sp. DHB23]MBD8873322.1 heavy metal translocating P-type ATPase [Rhodanobacter sp. DHB23]